MYKSSIFYFLYDWKYKLHLSTEFLAGNEPLESVFELPKGWALKSNQKYGQKGYGNHISVQITSLLEGFFLAGEADRTRYTTEAMLNFMVEEGQPIR